MMLTLEWDWGVEDVVWEEAKARANRAIWCGEKPPCVVLVAPWSCVECPGE